LLSKFHHRTNVMSFLVTNLGSKNTTVFSEFWILTSNIFWLRKVKSWVLMAFLVSQGIKLHKQQFFMHSLLPICGKFTRALLAHQIFYIWKSHIMKRFAYKNNCLSGPSLFLAATLNWCLNTLFFVLDLKIFDKSVSFTRY
jgi:hypothetical protein